MWLHTINILSIEQNVSERNGNCKNPCLNGPERCNCVAEPETKKPKTGGNTK